MQKIVRNRGLMVQLLTYVGRMRLNSDLARGLVAVTCPVALAAMLFIQASSWLSGIVPYFARTGSVTPTAPVASAAFVLSLLLSGLAFLVPKVVSKLLPGERKPTLLDLSGESALSSLDWGTAAKPGDRSLTKMTFNSQSSLASLDGGKAGEESSGKSAEPSSGEQGSGPARGNVGAAMARTQRAAPLGQCSGAWPGVGVPGADCGKRRLASTWAMSGRALHRAGCCVAGAEAAGATSAAVLQHRSMVLPRCVRPARVRVPVAKHLSATGARVMLV